MRRSLGQALFLSTLIATGVTGAAQADLGLPTIQAVCRIETNDGRVFEGMIETARGGYSSYFSTHGILLVRANAEEPLNGKPEFFDLDFVSISPRVGIPETNHWGEDRGVVRAYYCRDLTSDEYYIDDVTIEAKSELGDSYPKVRRSVVINAAYELSDSISLYTEITPVLYLEYDSSCVPLRICVADIKKLELLRDPSSDWLTQIRTATNSWLKRLMEDENGSGDYMPPDWFHEIARDKDGYQFKNRFRPWSL